MSSVLRSSISPWVVACLRAQQSVCMVSIDNDRWDQLSHSWGEHITVPHWRRTDCLWTIKDHTGYRSNFEMSIFITIEMLLSHQLPPKTTQVANMDLVMKPPLLRETQLEYEYPWYFWIWCEHWVNTVLILHLGPDEASMPSKLYQFPCSFVIDST